MTQELLYLRDPGRTPGMYPSAQAPRLPAQAQYIPPPYDFTGYHQLGGVGDPSTSSWNSVYAPREEYPYSFLGSSPNAGQVSYTSPDIGAPPTAAGGSSFTPYNVFSSQETLCSKGRPHEPIRAPVSGGKTRTKDKYRVVYTDHQRQELENEFQYNSYITMRRKTELSMALSLSERQVKIWFQNRRAKERKINRKRQQQHSQQPSTSTPTPPALEGSTDPTNTTSPAINLLSDAISDEY